MKLPDAEWQIMNALWKRYAATARVIFDEITSPHGRTFLPFVYSRPSSIISDGLSSF